MVERYRAAEATAPFVPGNVFLVRKEITFLNTGCTLLNCVIGGGWPLGRVVNVVGDKSTGKTLLAEEAIANFLLSFPRGKVFYRESEAAFDSSYAQALGVDTDQVDFGPEGPDTHWQTIEGIFDDLRARLDACEAEVARKAKALREKNKRMKPAEAEAKALATIQPSLYIIDSLDAVSTEDEIKRNIHEGSYNLGKQKLLGELFRTEIKRIKRYRMCFFVISQIRDRIGAMIRGKKYTRAGGRSLDFYASIVLYLSDLGKVYEQIKGIKRPVAIKIRAKAEKNKITMPFRECVFELRFGYGIDDDWACLDFLKETKQLKIAGFDDMPKTIEGVDLAKLKADTVKVWYNIEKGFTPEKGKYVA